jgi:predicted integral membrane protein DUF2269
MLFEVLLALHILSAVIFVGNIITAAFWKVRADLSGNLEVIALTTRAVLTADWAFTGPGILVLLGTGLAMVGLTGWERFQELWLGLSFILLIVTGIIWIVRSDPSATPHGAAGPGRGSQWHTGLGLLPNQPDVGHFWRDCHAITGSHPVLDGPQANNGVENSPLAPPP